MRNLIVACAVTLVMFSSAPSSAVAARGRTGGEVEVTPEGPKLGRAEYGDERDHRRNDERRAIRRVGAIPVRTRNRCQHDRSNDAADLRNHLLRRANRAEQRFRDGVRETRCQRRLRDPEPQATQRRRQHERKQRRARSHSGEQDHRCENDRHAERRRYPFADPDRQQTGERRNQRERDWAGDRQSTRL